MQLDDRKMARFVAPENNMYKTKYRKVYKCRNFNDFSMKTILCMKKLTLKPYPSTIDKLLFNSPFIFRV